MPKIVRAVNSSGVPVSEATNGAAAVIETPAKNADGSQVKEPWK